jgi:predicted phage-related endonuclease
MIAAVLGINPHQSPVDAYLALTEDEPEPDERTKELWFWGRELEPIILKNYALREGVEVVGTQRELVHREFDFLRGHIDAETDRDGLRVVEAKNHDRFIQQKYGAAGTDEVPDYVLAQGLFYCELDPRYRGVDFPVCFGGNTGRTFMVDRDPELGEKIIQVAVDFWQGHVVPRVPPPPQTEADLLRLFPSHTLALRTVDEDAYGIVLEHARVKARLKDLEAEEKTLKYRVQDLIREHEGLEIDGKVLVTWKQARASKRLNTERLKAEWPEVWAACQEDVSGSRRFLNKLVKDVTNP